MTLSTAPKTVSTTVSTMSRAALCALLGLCLLAGLLPRAGAASVASYVVLRTADDTLPGSLRAAITAASATGGTVTFAIPVTDPGYSSVANTDTITLSLGALTVPASLTIAGPVAPSATVIVSGASQSNVFSVTGGTVAISNLTITKGSAQGGGGDIQNAATLTLTGCTVTGGSSSQGPQGQASQGGDILNTATLTMNTCTVSGGSAFGDGAGISNSGSGASLTLTGCTVSGNTAQFGNGGGLANSGTLTATGCLIKSNGDNSQGLAGGGGFANTGTATLNGCTLSGNSVGGNGNGAGGGGAFNTGSLTLNNCLVDSNYGVGSSFGGGNGAGIYSSGGTLVLSACTVSNNVGSSGGNAHQGGVGGGIACFGTTQITDCLIVNNSGNQVGGVDNGGALTLINSTFADNSGVPAPFGPPNSPPTIGGLYSGPATLINDIFYFDSGAANNTSVVSEIVAASGTSGLTVSYSDVQGGYPGTGNISADPQFVRNPYTNSGTDLGDEHLKLTSPAVHAGANGPGVPLTDIEGTARPTPPATPSMGAYEVPGSASGFSAQGGFLVSGTQNVSTGSQVVAKFLPGSTPAASFTAGVNLGDGSQAPGVIAPDPNTAGVYDVTVSHTYTAYGTFPIAVTVSGPNNAPAATVTSSANIQPAQVAVDVTGQVSVVEGGLAYNRATKRYVQTVTITNNTAAAITGPISLVLDNLSAGVAVYGPTGTTQYAPPAGSPYLNAAATSIAANAAISVTVQLTYGGAARISYTPRVLAGPGAR